MTIGSLLAARDAAAVGEAPAAEAAIHCARAAEPLSAVVARLAEHRIGAMPVLAEAGSVGDAGEVIGVISERDVVLCLDARGTSALDAPVSDAMTSPAVTITLDTPVLVALSLMTRRRIRHLPVVEGGRMVGFVSIGDLVKFRIQRIEAEAAALRDYIAS